MSCIPNYLLRETAERFLEVGCEPYFQALGEYFGTTVQYLFFDQPHANVYTWEEHFGDLRSSLPFADGLNAIAESATGAAFPTALLALLVDVGPSTDSLRASFYEAYSDLVCAAYLGALRTWAEAHDVGLSGHEVLGHVGSWNPGGAFSNWDLRANFGLDYFKVDGYRHITGVDAQDCVPQLSPKLGDSVARSHGRSGCIVEQYMLNEPGGKSAYAGYWGLTLEELRAQAIRLHVLGARQFLFHGFYQTDGNGEDFTRLRNPRFDFAPGINFEPWWPYHREFADESGRLSVFLDDAAPICEVALFYPLRTAWTEGAAHSWAGHVAFWAAFLAERGFGYHLVDEADVRTAKVDGGSLVLGDRSYPFIVLPSATTLRDEKTARVMAEFVGKGGRLVATGTAPCKSQLGTRDALAQAWDSVASSANYVHIGGIPQEDEAEAALVGVRDERPYAVQRGADGPLWQWAGRDDTAWRLVLFNDSRQHAAAELHVPSARMAVEVWRAGDGKRFGWQELAGSTALRRVSLEPMELRCLRLRTLDADEALGVADWDVSEVDDEVVVLDTGWSLELPACAPVPVMVDRGWEQQGFPRVSGVGTYRTQVRLRGTRSGVKLVLPLVHCAAETRWNGVSLGRRGWSPYEFDVPAPLVVGGDNELEVVVSSSAANKYFGGTPFDPGPAPSGLGAPPELRVPRRR